MSSSMDSRVFDYEFSNRLIGVELEIPEYNHRLGVEMERRGWSVKDDGSIPSEGREFVSQPIKGRQIRSDLNAFYKWANEQEIRTDHPTCGIHVHINAGDIYDLLNSVTGSDLATMENRVHEWGMTMSALSRLFVGPVRNGTRFARGGFAIRSSYYCDPKALKRLRRQTYPTIAIREGTFEFRIFPSTTNAAYTIARAAFCQASGDWLLKNMQLTENTWNRRFAVLCAPLVDEVALVNAEVVKDSLVSLGIVGATLDTLMLIYMHFREGNKTILPSLWQNEREIVRQQEATKRTLRDSVCDALTFYHTPENLLDMMHGHGELFGNFLHECQGAVPPHPIPAPTPRVSRREIERARQRRNESISEGPDGCDCPDCYEASVDRADEERRAYGGYGNPPRVLAANRLPQSLARFEWSGDAIEEMVRELSLEEAAASTF